MFPLKNMKAPPSSGCFIIMMFCFLIRIWSVKTKTELISFNQILM